MYLPDHEIRELLNNGLVDRFNTQTYQGAIQPASLDLFTSVAGFRVPGSVLPLPGESVDVMVDRLERTYDAPTYVYSDMVHLESRRVLYPGNINILSCLGRWTFPSDVGAICDPRSSTGRTDILIRLLADGVPHYGAIPPGFHGYLYLEIVSQSFAASFANNHRFAQLRFYRESEVLDDLLLPPPQTLHIDFSPPTSGWSAAIVADEAVGADVGLDQLAVHNQDWYWVEVPPSPNGYVYLPPNRMILVRTKERVAIRDDQCASVEAYNPKFGELRSHYAGFIDPGFGMTHPGGNGAPIVLEIRSHSTPLLLQDGQPIATLITSPLTSPAERPYGSGIGSFYSDQELKLPRYFFATAD